MIFIANYLEGKKMRKKNAFLNSIAGSINRVVIIITSFVVRFFLAKYLISEYIGLNGLFANIIGVLSLVDMGLGTAISFSLYKPLHEKDEQLVSAIMSLYKKLYIILGCAIFILSICLIPFLDVFVKETSLSMKYICEAFLVYSIGTSASYFFSYNRTLLFAMQKNYIVQVVDILCNIICSFIQIITLIVYKNFILYLGIQFIFTFISNIIISRFVSKNKLINNEKYTLPKKYKKDLFTKVKALAITNICGVAITSTDNIIISMLVGMSDLAKNSNYSLIVQAIKSLVVTAIGGAMASIGDLIAEANINKINFYFEKYTFTYFVVASFCSICLYFLLDPFICIWVGERYLFSTVIKLILVINLYLILNLQPIATFLNLSGLYTVYKNISIVAAVINIALSIILGMKIGILGVFLGTMVSYIYQNFYLCRCLHNSLLKKKTIHYFVNQLKYGIFTILVFILVSLENRLVINNYLLELIINIVLICGNYTVIFYLFFYKDDNYIYFIDIFKNIIRRN